MEEFIPQLTLYQDPRHFRHSLARRIGFLLELPPDDCKDALALAKAVFRGLSPDSVDQLVDLLGRDAVLGPIISDTTYRHASKTKSLLSRRISDRIIGVSQVVDAAARRCHGDHARMTELLCSPRMILRGKSLLEVASSTVAGAYAVANVIDQGEEGIAL